MAPAPFANGQPTDQPVRRLRGIINNDETWSGSILITDDLLIQDATVTISAGTTIEFAHQSPGHHPILTVGSPTRPGGQFRLLATAAAPITFRTRPGTNTGRLVINIRSRIMSKRAISTSQPSVLSPRPSAYVPNDVAWQHVRFEDLGHPRERRRGAGKTRLVEPGVTFNVLGAAHTLGVVSCVFEKTTRLLVRAADGAKITLAANRFDEPRERVSLEVLGREGAEPAGPMTITGNSMAAALRLRDAAGVVSDNLLIGRDAAMVIEGREAAELRISGNYVHNTTKQDDGRYCLKCDNPAARIEGNILRGGTTCVWSGSRRMSGNVLIAAARLSGRLVKDAHTHQLVQALPFGAVFEGNLLLGPAYSLLIPHPGPARRRAEGEAGPTLIQHNLFDGFSCSNRAIHLNPVGRSAVKVAVSANLFLRIGTLVYDEGRTEATLTYADYNAVAPPADRAFDGVKIGGTRRGDPGWGAKDVVCQDVTSVYLVAPPDGPLGDHDPDLLAGRLSIARLREQLFAAYRPQRRSPLVGAGRPPSVAGPRGDSRSSVAPPSIGPSEPAGG